MPLPLLREGPARALGPGSHVSRVFFLADHAAKPCSVACALSEEMEALSLGGAFYRVFHSSELECVCCPRGRKRRRRLARSRPAQESRRRPAKGFGCGRLEGRSLTRAASESWTGPCRDFRSFQTRAIQKGMIIKIPYTSKLSECFYRHCHWALLAGGRQGGLRRRGGCGFPGIRRL